jgi:hypothetical protein
MKIEINDLFKPALESLVDGERVKTVSEALNMHLLKTLKPLKTKPKPGMAANPEQAKI